MQEIARQITSTKKDVFKQQISGLKWNDHFKDILVNKERMPEFSPDSIENDHLDYPITENELRKASHVLKPKKSSGYHSVSNEMILRLLVVTPLLLIKLFHSIFYKRLKDCSMVYIPDNPHL